MTGVILESNVICGLDKTMSITLSIRSGGDGNGSGSYPEPGYDYATVVSEAMGHIERSYGGISGTENHTEKLDLISPEERAVHSYFRQQLVRYLLISSGINSENFEPDCFDYDNTGLLLPFEAREEVQVEPQCFIQFIHSPNSLYAVIALIPDVLTYHY